MDRDRLVRIGDIARELGLSASRVRPLADESRIPSIGTSRGHRLFDPAGVREASTLASLPGADRRPPDLVQDDPADGLEEHLGGLAASERLHLPDRVSAQCWGATQYGFSEMVDNAIDHSGADQVQEVGQGFVDEVFRVWPRLHPEVTVRPVDMVGPVEAMVRRGLPRPPH